MRAAAVLLLAGMAASSGAQPSTARVESRRPIQFEGLVGKRAFAGGVRWNKVEYGALRIDGWRVERVSFRDYGSQFADSERLEKWEHLFVTAGADGGWRRGRSFGSVGAGLGFGTTRKTGHYSYSSTGPNPSPPQRSYQDLGGNASGFTWTIGSQIGFDPVVVGAHAIGAKRLNSESFWQLTVGIRY